MNKLFLVLGFVCVAVASWGQTISSLPRTNGFSRKDAMPVYNLQSGGFKVRQMTLDDMSFQFAAFAQNGQRRTPWAVSWLDDLRAPQVVASVAIQPSNNFHNAFPAVAYDWKRGCLVAAWTMGTNHQQTAGVLRWSESYNGGKTWTPAVTKFNWAGGAAVWGSAHVGLCAAPDGSLLLTHQLRQNGGNYNPSNYFMRTFDGGATWQTNSMLTMTNTASGMVNGSIVVAPDGSILVGIMDVAAADPNNNASVLRSTDNGRTWNQTVIDAKGNELGLAVHPNGYVYANVRTGSDVPFPWRNYFSTNNGVTWTGPFTNTVTDGYIRAFPHTVFAGGRMYVSGRSNPSYYQHLYYADDFPYYTNFSDFTVTNVPSLYAAMVPLSESVVGMVMSGPVDNPFGYGSTNAAIWFEALAENGLGYAGNWKTAVTNFVTIQTNIVTTTNNYLNVTNYVGSGNSADKIVLGPRELAAEHSSTYGGPLTFASTGLDPMQWISDACLWPNSSANYVSIPIPHDWTNGATVNIVYGQNTGLTGDVVWAAEIRGLNLGTVPGSYIGAFVAYSTGTRTWWTNTVTASPQGFSAVQSIPTAYPGVLTGVTRRMLLWRWGSYATFNTNVVVTQIELTRN